MRLRVQPLRSHRSGFVMSEVHAHSDGGGEFAAEAVSRWRAIDAALSPIIGQRGVSTLYQRSVHRAGKTVPSLLAARDNALRPGDFGPLQALLAALPITEASAVNKALHQTFDDLLASLIGPSLTDRLLRSVQPMLEREQAVTRDGAS